MATQVLSATLDYIFKAIVNQVLNNIGFVILLEQLNLLTLAYAYFLTSLRYNQNRGNLLTCPW